MNAYDAVAGSSRGQVAEAQHLARRELMSAALRVLNYRAVLAAGRAAEGQATSQEPASVRADRVLPQTLSNA